MGWKQKLEKALRSGMRYCFRSSEGYPTLDEAEFVGEDGSGYLFYMQSVVFDMRKQAFRAGYAAGVKDCYLDMGGADKDFVLTEVDSDDAFKEFDGKE